MTETTQLRVMDFDCPTCASTVERALASTEGVAAVEVHYTTGRIEVTYDESTTSPDAFARVIENQGYTPQRA
jgi:copper chaperone CopZ